MATRTWNFGGFTEAWQLRQHARSGERFLVVQRRYGDAAGATETLATAALHRSDAGEIARVILGEDERPEAIGDLLDLLDPEQASALAAEDDAYTLLDPAQLRAVVAAAG